MNVMEFAERVVFGKTLEDKLMPPGHLSGDGCPTTVPLEKATNPGRPRGMEIHSGSGLSQPPADNKLENERERGRLLHFLANHELLATELMALVLLKFPDAPHEFRRGVLVTLQEEQEHTRLYLDRMTQCGVEFGSYPLSGHFWRVVEPMRCPLDFVSRLSLTFEQANLDYSLHFASRFRRVGDDATAEVLERIYRDEIGHVQHGLKWFREWKDPHRTDWEAYRDSLTFPMSPQRARGPACNFNRRGRLEAGLAPEFVDQVEVFRQSRGRPPVVRWFDAAAESELAGPLAARERALTDQLGRDLECLMIWLSAADDTVLVRKMPSMEFRKYLLQSGANLPEFLPISESAQLGERIVQQLAPWAWTPASHELATPIAPVTRTPTPAWDSANLDLFRKTWCADQLRSWLAIGDAPTWFAGPETVGESVRSVRDVVGAMEKIRDGGFTHALFKQDIATSGRGQRRLDCQRPLLSDDEVWLTNSLSMGPGIVEPELDRVLDLSFLWRSIDGGSHEFLGWTRQLVSAGRRFAGTRLQRPFDEVPNELKRFLLANDCERLNAVRGWLEEHLVRELQAREFAGHFGVDVFVYADHQQGNPKIKPCVELNPRVTMGHVALRLQKMLAPVAPAEFRILTKREWETIRSKCETATLVRSDDGRWVQGIVRLSEPEPNSKLMPVVFVGSEALGLRTSLSLSHTA